MKCRKNIGLCITILGICIGFGAGCSLADTEEPSLPKPEVISGISHSVEEIREQADDISPEGEMNLQGDAETLSEDDFSEEESVEEPKDIYITISAAGDCSLGNYHGQDYSYSFIQTYEQQQNPGYFLENVREIFEEDDMTIVNLEGVLTNSGQIAPGRTYNISGPPEYVKILTAGDVEAVSMANNHRLDYGEGGTEDTVKALEEEQIVYAYDTNVGMYEVPEKEIKIGFVSVNAINNSGAVEKQVQDGLDSLKEDGADLLLVCCHWGIERDHFPNDTQKNLARKCIDWGADIVIGHHPHVLQGLEEYQGKMIIYSLGNFSFGANRNPTDKDTMIYQQTFHFVDGVKQEDTTAKIIPCKVSSVGDRNNYQPTPAMEDSWTKIIDRMNQFSAPFGVEIDEDGYCKR